MDIHTKFQIGQVVWYKGYKEIFCAEIFKINIEVKYGGKIVILYELWDDAIKYENEIFASREELLNYLTTKK